MGLYHIYIILTIATCRVHWADAWYLPQFVHRSSNPPIIRILDANSGHQEEENPAVIQSTMKPIDEESLWMAGGLGQDFSLPTVDEISYSLFPPRKVLTSQERNQRKLHKEDGQPAVNPNHFHFRVTR